MPRAGVHVEVIPGISAANGAAAAAQLPLTHRDLSSAVTFVAGQCKGLTEQDWTGLAGKGRTLVIYMGVATGDAIAEKLIADGLSPDTPAAVLEKGTRADMRTLRTLLTDLGPMIAREQVVSPALIVIGDVVTRANATDCCPRSLPSIWRPLNENPYRQRSEDRRRHLVGGRHPLVAPPRR